MKNNESILEHAFKANKPEQIKKILQIEHKTFTPVAFTLLLRASYLDKTLALGKVLEQSLIELAQKGKNIFNYLLTYRPSSGWMSYSAHSLDEKAIPCYFKLFNHLNENNPVLLQSLMNTPDQYGVVPLIKFFACYEYISKQCRYEELKTHMPKLIELTNLNYYDKKNDNSILQSYVSNTNQTFKYNQLSLIALDYLPIFLDLLIKSGLDLNLALDKGNSAMLKVLPNIHDDTLKLFLPYFDKINFNITNDEGLNFFDVLSTKEGQVKIEFEKYYLHQTIEEHQNKKKIKI